MFKINCLLLFFKREGNDRIRIDTIWNVTDIPGCHLDRDILEKRSIVRGCDKEIGRINDQKDHYRSNGHN